MTEPSWTMNDTDRQIISGPYAAPEVFVPASLGLTGLAENLSTWVLAFLDGLIGSKPVNIGDGAVGMDLWRRDSVLKSRPALNASPALNRNPVEEARLELSASEKRAAEAMKAWVNS